MAVLQCFTFLLVGVIVPTGVFSQAIITLTPGILELTPDQADKGEGQVNVTCQGSLTIEGREELQQLSIVLSPWPPQTEKTVVRASRNAAIRRDGAAELRVNPAELPGATVSGNIRDRSITLTLGKATCLDARRKYICRAFYRKLTSPSAWVPARYFPVTPTPDRVSENTTRRENSSNLTVNVTPGPLTLTPSPRKTGCWKEGQVLTLNCQGPLGTAHPGRQAELVWQYRDDDSDTGPWQLYDGPPTDVSTEVLPPAPCYARGRSTLTRRLTLADSGRQYRCTVALGGVSIHEGAASYRVGSVCPADEPDADLNHSLVLGMGVGGGVGMVVGLVFIIVIAVVFVVWKRRQMSAARKPANCPLLPAHRDPTWYGEYLEPVVRHPQEDEVTVYSEIPNYEDIEIVRSPSAVTPAPTLSSPFTPAKLSTSTDVTITEF